MVFAGRIAAEKFLPHFRRVVRRRITTPNATVEVDTMVVRPGKVIPSDSRCVTIETVVANCKPRALRTLDGVHLHLRSWQLC